MEVIKRFKWIMGHRLTFHQGGCYNPHGHNYECEVTVSGVVNKDGILLDFSELSEAFKVIHNELDHCFMVYKSDSFMYTLINFEGRQFKIVVVDFETTAENIAEYLLQRFEEMLNSPAEGYKVTKVKVFETPTSAVTCDAGDV